MIDDLVRTIPPENVLLDGLLTFGAIHAMLIFADPELTIRTPAHIVGKLLLPTDGASYGFCHRESPPFLQTREQSERSIALTACCPSVLILLIVLGLETVMFAFLIALVSIRTLRLGIADRVPRIGHFSNLLQSISLKWFFL